MIFSGVCCLTGHISTSRAMARAMTESSCLFEVKNMSSICPSRPWGRPPTFLESSHDLCGPGQVLWASSHFSGVLRGPRQVLRGPPVSVGVRLSSIFPVSVLPLCPLGGTARLTSPPTQNIKDENRLPRVVPADHVYSDTSSTVVISTIPGTRDRPAWCVT